MHPTELIQRFLRKCRDMLANLSRRNKELYFRETKSSVNLTKMPSVDDEFDNELQLKFVPVTSCSVKLEAAFHHMALDLSEHFQLEETKNDDMVRRLEKIRTEDQKYQKEFGISGAWLLGPFLCWREAHDFKIEDLLVTPIFKLPIDIEKDKKKNWKLKLEDGQLSYNPALRIALKAWWGIELPETIEAANISGSLREFQVLLKAADKDMEILQGYDSIPKIPPRFKIIKDEDGEIVERVPVKIEEAVSKEDLAIYQGTTAKQFKIIDAMYIDQLNASRATLINDYETIIELCESHPILSELLLGNPVSSETSKGRDAIKALDGYKEKENFFVVDIDSTQHRAIDKVSKSRAVVIQGPPGTGKSQTITNLIADNLAKGKKVLFVSEKRPALDVVYSRLQQASLQSQTVLIHSSDLSKQDLYKSFLELSEAAPDHKTDRSWSETADKLDTIKTELNAYYNFLGEEHQPSDLLISDLLTIYSQAGDGAPDITVYEALGHLPYSKLKLVSEELDEVQASVSKVPGFKSHIWRNRKSDVIYSETLKAKLIGLIGDITQIERKIGAAQSKIVEMTGAEFTAKMPSSAELNAARAMSFPTDALLPIVAIAQDPTIIAKVQVGCASALSKVSEYLDDYKKVPSDVAPELVRELELYYAAPRGFFDVFTPTFWRMRRSRKSLCPSVADGNRPFVAYRVVKESISEARGVMQPFGFVLSAEQMSADQLPSVLPKVLVELKSVVSVAELNKKIGPKFTERFKFKTLSELAENLAAYGELTELIDELRGALEVKSQLVARLIGYFETPPEVKIESPNEALYQLLLDGLQDLDGLDRVKLQTDKLALNCKAGSASKLVDHLSEMSPASWGVHCIYSVVRGWLDEIRTKQSLFRTFDRAQFMKKIEAFQEQERLHRESARDVVNNMLYKRWNGGAEESKGLAILKKEASKQRRVLSPREVMEAGSLSAMMKLKPCWLMSPLSISQILPLQAGLFDVIIFDEASQVRVEDAIPSIYRSNTMVVVGDPKQMPPTNFFSGGEVEDEDSEGAIEIAQSILDLASQVYPAEMLEWHYRSRAEALIAYSNRAFYGGRLIAVPNPHVISDSDAIKFTRVPDGLFNQRHGNVVEAAAIVDHLYEVLKKSPDKSVGVIALGQSQMAAVDKLIEERSLVDEKFRHVIEEARNFKDGDSDAGLFVKNLENVQGDERDIIIMSVGYAPVSKEKKLRLGFGPLSMSGGGRRLNVAITRAKEVMHIFCSFDPAEIPTTEEAFAKNPDSVFFGRYLKYAKAISERRPSEALAILDSFGVSGAITGRKSSGFSKDVQRRLVELGIQVSAEIGSSGFYIDLGVHHQVIPTNFVLGIECDGAMFHSTPYARDRDKIRQTLLESRGWKIIRIWSQDWSKDWKSEVARIKLALEEASQARVGLS